MPRPRYADFAVETISLCERILNPSASGVPSPPKSGNGTESRMTRSLCATIQQYGIDIARAFPLTKDLLRALLPRIHRTSNQERLLQCVLGIAFSCLSARHKRKTAKIVCRIVFPLVCYQVSAACILAWASGRRPRLVQKTTNRVSIDDVHAAAVHVQQLSDIHWTGLCADDEGSISPITDDDVCCLAGQSAAAGGR